MSLQLVLDREIDDVVVAPRRVDRDGDLLEALRRGDSRAAELLVVRYGEPDLADLQHLQERCSAGYRASPSKFQRRLEGVQHAVQQLVAVDWRELVAVER